MKRRHLGASLLLAVIALIVALGAGELLIRVASPVEYLYPRYRFSPDYERGEIRYLEVTEWLSGMSNYASPEGHTWGTPAHRVLGERLAEEVTALAVPERPATPTRR
jgi:hypothetical protein